MPPRKDEEAESRKRGSADVELDGGGARRKGARTEAAAAAATSAKTEENGGARAGRTKGLRVKLAGAGKCTRRGAEEESVADDPGAEESVANPTADAPAAETVGGGSGGGGGPAEVPAAKFQVGAVIILYNGSLRYEAEVLKVSLSEPKKSAPTAKGGRGRVASPGPSISYLVRYTKWPRRPEEWVGEAFAYQWDEPLAKIVTNRPPRKQMWAEATGPARAPPAPAHARAPRTSRTSHLARATRASCARAPALHLHRICTASARPAGGSSPRPTRPSRPKPTAAERPRPRATRRVRRPRASRAAPRPRARRRPRRGSRRRAGGGSAAGSRRRRGRRGRRATRRRRWRAWGRSPTRTRAGWPC